MRNDPCPVLYYILWLYRVRKYLECQITSSICTDFLINNISVPSFVWYVILFIPDKWVNLLPLQSLPKELIHCKEVGSRSQILKLQSLREGIVEWIFLRRSHEKGSWGRVTGIKVQIGTGCTQSNPNYITNINTVRVETQYRDCFYFTSIYKRKRRWCVTFKVLLQYEKKYLRAKLRRLSYTSYLRKDLTLLLVWILESLDSLVW